MTYEGQIEAFGVYCPDTHKCYLVPITEVGGRQANLRVSPSKNKQEKGIRWAKEFEI